MLDRRRRRGRLGEIGSHSAAPRGQSLVEFALVLPMLLVLLLGVADLGRVFAAGITLEALSRNAAEAAAQEYLQLRRGTSGSEPDAGAYSLVLDRAQKVGCREARTLPGHKEDAFTGSCQMPVIGACVHDEWGDHCGATSTPSVPAECSQLAGWPTVLSDQPGGLPYVRVNACYQFKPMISITLPLNWSQPVGETWLQRQRIFTVADY